ncbi:MAG: FAD-dependent oxidoreductase, partial [Actinomycetota bacterium]
DHVGPIFERAIHRVPALAECGIQLLFNGPEAFTPDGVCYLGEAPTVDGCFVAAGFNSVGIQLAGGVGWALADLIADGIPPVDLTAADLRRAQPFQTEPDYLAERIPESLGLLYAMHWPHQQYEGGRNRRQSPLHHRLDDAGAVFGETAGWERPNWFARPGQERVYRYSYGRQNWFDNMVEECRSVREAAGLFDQSSFGQFEVSGPDALAVLDHVSAAAIDRPELHTAYTQWCNDLGGIEADLTVTRLGPDRFLVVTGAAARVRDLAWLRRSARGHDVTIDDLTERRTMLGLMGPASRAILADVAHDGLGADARGPDPLGADALGADALGADAMPLGTGRWMEVAGVAVLGLRMTYVGELGWELYLDAADAVTVFDAIVEAGRPHGLRPAGYHAMDSLRLEAGYRHYGHDLSDQETPIEAGLGFACAGPEAHPGPGRPPPCP